MSTTRRSYPSDVTDGEGEFLLPYLCLMREDAPQREYPLRELFNALRYVVKTGCQFVGCVATHHELFRAYRWCVATHPT